MHFKHGLRSDLRTPGRAVLTISLFFLVIALLGTSLGTVWSVRQALHTLSQSYITIAAAVLDSGTETPEASDVARAADVMDSLPLPDGALRWDANRWCQAWLPEASEIIDNSSVSDYGVVLVSVKEAGVFSTRNTLPASVLQVLFSVKNVAGKNLELYAEGLEPGKRYLVYGRWYVGSLGVAYCMEALEPPLEVPDPDAWEQTPGARTYEQLAERLNVRRYSVRAVFPEDPAVSFPFQQKAVQLIQGRSFTPEELTGSARVCMISERLAKLEGLELGDQLPLTLAVGNDPSRTDCYDPAQGFDLEAEFKIVGIFYTKSDWENVLFLPPQAELDLSHAKSESLLGQYLLDNDQADRFLQASEGTLPEGIRLTVYDQGYGQAAEPLRLMLRTTSLIALLCALAALCFLALNLWLFVNRQRQAGVLMDRLGAPRAAVPVYFLSAMVPLALPALGGGVWFSHWAAEAVTRQLGELLSRDPSVSSRFSDAKLTLRRTVELIETPAPMTLYLILAGALLLLSCLLCWLLAERTVPRVRQKTRLRGLRTRTRTQTLRGGAAKYALLAARRGGFRTAVTLLAPLAAAILLCGLDQSRQNTELRLRDIETNTEIRGYFTDLNGSSAQVALLKLNEVLPLAELPETTHLTITQYGEQHVQIVCALDMELRSLEVYHDDTKTGEPEILNLPHYSIAGPVKLPEIPYGEFQASRLARQSATNDPLLIHTNSMSDLPQLMFRNEDIQWLEFRSDESMQCHPIYLQVQADGSVISVEDPAEATTMSLPPSSLTGYVEQTTPEKSWDAEQRKIRSLIDSSLELGLLLDAKDCVVSDALLEEWDLRLGGYFLQAVTGLWADRAGSGQITLIPYHIIGVYHGSSPRDPIFLSSELPVSVGEEASALCTVFEKVRSLNPYLYDLSLKSAVFRFRASDLEGLKQCLAELGFTEVGDASGVRKPFLLEDQVFLATKRSVEQRLWYMDRIFPVVSGLVLLLALILSVLQLLARRREIWLMHCTGTGRARAFGSLFAEQAGLCLLGLAAGLGLCRYFRLFTTQGLALSLGFGGLWLLGACVMGLCLTRRPVKSDRDE